MKNDALYRIIGGIVLVAFALLVAAVKSYDSGGIAALVSADVTLFIGCLAIALLGILVAAAGYRYLKKIRRMTDIIGWMVGERNHIITKEIAGAVGLHEVDVRERIDEMIKERSIPAGTRITYSGGEKVVR